jgi:hypothetical protein
MITITKQEYLQILREIQYWKAQEQHVCDRVEAIEKEIQQKEAIIKDLNQRINRKTSKQLKGNFEVNDQA